LDRSCDIDVYSIYTRRDTVDQYKRSGVESQHYSGRNHKVVAGNVVDTRPRLRSDEPSGNVVDSLSAPVCEDLAYLETVYLCCQSEVTAATERDKSASETVVQGDLVGGKVDARIVVD
jgi:hypothetical protein